jgi:hypothetical protein
MRKVNAMMRFGSLVLVRCAHQKDPFDAMHAFTANANAKRQSFIVNSTHSYLRLSAVSSSSLRAAIQRHLLIMLGSVLKRYFELASRRRRRLLTIMAAVWCRSKFTRRSPSTGAASMKAGFWAL